MADAAPAAPVAAVPVKAPTGTEVPTTPPVAAKPAPKPTETAPVAGKSAAKVEPKPEDLFEIVVDGEKQTLTREQVTRQLQKEAAADKRFREAQEQTKKFQRALEAGKQDPDELLKFLGMDPSEYAKKVMARQAEDALLDPKERELRDLKRQNEDYKSKQAELEQKHAKTQQEAADKQIWTKLEQSFVAAAEAGGLEGTPDNLIRMIEVANEAVDLGIPLTEQQIVSEVKEREDKAFGSLEKKVLAGLKGDKLAQRLGKAVVEEILNWSVARIRGTNPYKAPESKPAEPKEKPSPYINEDEYRKRMKL